MRCCAARPKRSIWRCSSGSPMTLSRGACAAQALCDGSGKPARSPISAIWGWKQHARFVARLWQDLGQGYLGADFVAARIAELDRMQGDIDTLQGRIAAIRSWAYICQRPDWVLARDENGCAGTRGRGESFRMRCTRG